MDAILTCFLVAVSLSMDAFSLALIYGTCAIGKKNELLLSIIVGLFHFLMPLLGLGFGSILMQYFIFDLELLVAILFFIIGIEMIISTRKEEKTNVFIGLVHFLLFGLSVSIDSFTTGIGMAVISNNYITISVLFMVVSGIFTYIGLGFGNKLSKKIGKYATICGGILMCLLAIFRLL